jgi:hypothetical protein
MLKRDEEHEHSLPFGHNGVSAPVPNTSGYHESVFTHRNSTEHEEQLGDHFRAAVGEIDKFFAKKPAGRDCNLNTTDDVRDVGVGVLKEMYVKYNTRVPAGAVSRLVVAMCSRVMKIARVEPGDFHSKLVLLKANLEFMSHLNKNE